MHPQDLILAPPTLKPRPAQPDWPEVLTDWCAIRALEQAGVPIILQNAGEVQAAFISEVSAYLRFRALHLREAHAEACFDAVAETTLSEMGGPAYRAARGAFEATQGAFLKALVRARYESGDPVCDTLESEDATRLRSKLQECERELSLRRRRVEPSVRLARRRAAQTYWAAVAQCRMPEDFFRDAPRNSMLAEMPFHCATWWGLYVCWLGRVVARSNPAYCRLLQALPQLQAEAARPGQILTLAGLVQEWREANAERFGLLRDIHFPVLEQRAFVKHVFVNEWFEARAPRYKTDLAVREAAARRLYLRLERGPRECLQPYWNN
jgi:hypothetical protein